MNGKGSAQRPTDRESFSRNYDAVFGTRKMKKVQSQKLECGCEVDSDEDGEYVYCCATHSLEEIEKEASNEQAGNY